MTRNEEMAAILRAAADGADPFSQAQAYQQAFPSGSQQGVVMANVSWAAMEEGSRIASILRSMATVYETAHKAEMLAEGERLAALPGRQAP